MSRHPEPRRIELEGASVVVLPPEEYERLVLLRRQLGGQTSRMSSLNRDLALAARLLEEARDELRAGREGHDCAQEAERTSGRLCCRIGALLDTPRFVNALISSTSTDGGRPPRRRSGHHHH